MELRWTLQYSQTVWSLCGHCVVPPRGFRGFCFLGFVERFFQTLLETAWPLLIGVLVPESLCPTLDCGLSSSSLRAVRCWPGAFLGLLAWC